jgi:hypothetical protein
MNATSTPARRTLEDLERFLEETLPKQDNQEAKSPRKVVRRPARIETAGRSTVLLREPLPWDGHEPPLVLSRAGGFFGSNGIKPSQLVHALALGGSGSGKTASMLAPLLRAILRYRLPTPSGDKRTAAFVVDPKHELLPIVSAVLCAVDQKERLHHLGRDASVPPVRYFDADCAMSARERLDYLNLVTGTDRLAEGDHTYWQSAGMELVSEFMELESVGHAFSGECHSYIGCLRSMMVGSPKKMSFWPDLVELLRYARRGVEELKEVNEAIQNGRRSFGALDHPAADVLKPYVGLASQIDQFHYRVQSVEPLLNRLADPKVAALVDLNPYPNWTTPHLNLPECIDAGDVLLVQPCASAATAMATRAIKTKVFEAIRARQDMERPTAVVINEYQRFITDDPASGDAQFLDMARAYRCNAVLATQSLAALHLTLGGGHRAECAVQAVVANTPSKWFFACKDKSTQLELRNLIPAHHTGKHILDHRPMATLKPGEAYWSGADGRWGRRRARQDHLL